MGRHVDYRPSLVSRTLGPVFRALSAPFRVLFKSGRRQTIGSFAFTSALVLVTAVDPYSGTLAAAADTVYQGFADDQSFDYNSTETISFGRGGYNVVTGSKAAAMFVELAEVPSPGTAKAFAFKQVEARGWGMDQYSCLVKLWTRESNWRVNANNRSSGAYGIPQALPGSKMASAGADWMTNPETQIRWGLGYISGRYHTACRALAHSDEFNWY